MKGRVVKLEKKADGGDLFVMVLCIQPETGPTTKNGIVSISVGRNGRHRVFHPEPRESEAEFKARVTAETGYDFSVEPTKVKVGG